MQGDSSHARYDFRSSADAEDNRCHEYYGTDDDSVRILPSARKRPFTKVQYIPMVVLATLTILIFFVPLLDQVAQNALHRINVSLYKRNVCPDACRFSLVESIPEGLVYPDGAPSFPSTFETWKDLIEGAKESIEIGSFYWTLRGDDVVPHPSAKQGEEIFLALLNAGKDRKVQIRIAQSAPDRSLTSNDTDILKESNAADVRSVNFTQLLGGGVLHTKIWIVDNKDFYVGSANMDWRSLTQVKEMGIVGRNCGCLAKDLKKTFEIYWKLGNSLHIPDRWQKKFNTDINKENPISINDSKNVSYMGYISNSPLPLCPSGRTSDLDAILNTIRTAQKFVYISVMDYLPLTLYSAKIQFWPVIDDALRAVAIDGVHVKMLISHWKHSRPSQDNFLKSLMDLSESYEWVSVEIRHFMVPTSDDQKDIPFARVNHNKYMVTDNVAYIGTSNWSADYFIDTAGVGFVLRDVENATGIRSELQSVFERDWASNYSFPIE